MRQWLVDRIARILIAMCGGEPTQLNAERKWRQQQPRPHADPLTRPSGSDEEATDSARPGEA